MAAGAAQRCTGIHGGTATKWSNKLLAVKLMFHRKDLRCDTRPQALGRSGLGVDLDIYLHKLIQDKFGTTLDAIFEEFFAESGYNEKVWDAPEQVRSEPCDPAAPTPTHHPHAWPPPTHGPQHAPSSHPKATVACRSLLGQMLRVVVRFGILQRVFSPKVAAWALCFFGLVGHPQLASLPHPDPRCLTPSTDPARILSPLAADGRTGLHGRVPLA